MPRRLQRGVGPRMSRGPVPRHRRFDPRRVGGLECTAWVSYYRRQWPRFLTAAVGLTRHTFGLPWPQTLQGAWLVLRANQAWAPYPHNDPDSARRLMERFYALVKERHAETYDPGSAAALEVEWWRVHRARQREGTEDEHALEEALASLYGYVYGVPKDDVRPAARQRALAMDISDRWVQQGCRSDSPLVGAERAALVRSYAALLAAVHL